MQPKNQRIEQSEQSELMVYRSRNSNKKMTKTLAFGRKLRNTCLLLATTLVLAITSIPNPKILTFQAIAQTQATIRQEDLPGIACNETEKKEKGCWAGECRNKAGSLICICPPGLYGPRCEHIESCGRIRIEEQHLSGHDVCKLWTSRQHCIEDPDLVDLLRCSCDKHESFVFLNKTFFSQQAWSKMVKHINTIAPFPKSDSADNVARQFEEPKYLARCIPGEKCYGMKCRHMSEICVEGKCVCNSERGYWKLEDEHDDECKLTNPCLDPKLNDAAKPLCGQAKCIATFDRNLYRCVCPLGKHPRELERGLRNSTICDNIMVKHDSEENDSDSDNNTDSEDEDEPDQVDPNESPSKQPSSAVSLICENPMLNPCEHVCTNDASGFKCSCLPGYEPGSSEATEHLCYYERDLASNKSSSETNLAPSQECKRRLGCKEHEICVSNARGLEQCHCQRQGFVKLNQINPQGVEVAACVDWCWAAREDARLGHLLDQVCLSGICEMQVSRQRQSHSQEASEILKNEPNLIEFNSDNLNGDSNVSSKIPEGKPKFECDCSESKRLIKNVLGHCELNFTAILEVCMPGNDGYNDCVVNKGAYCSVLHQDVDSLREELKSKRRQNSALFSSPPSIILTKASHQEKLHEARRFIYDTQFAMMKRRQKLLRQQEMRLLNKNITLYACVCPPDKRMIEDQQRGRAICIKECQLMEDKCARMNRMCKRAQFNPDTWSYKQRNLIRRDWNSSYPPGSQWLLDIERAGCQCLPGFSPNLSQDQELNTIVHPSHASNYVMDPTKNCFMGDDVQRQVNASFKAPANFDLTWLRPVNESSWDEWSPTIPTKLSLTSIVASSNKSAPHKQQLATKIPINSKLAASAWFIPKFNELLPERPNWTRLKDANLLFKHFALVGECSPTWAKLSPKMYYECLGYRYWQEHVLKRHYVDWRRVLEQYLHDSYYLIRGLKVNINNCLVSNRVAPNTAGPIDILSDKHVLDGDLLCNLTVHTSNPNLDKSIQAIIPSLKAEIQQFIYRQPEDIDLDKETRPAQALSEFYHRVAPSLLITKEFYKQMNDELRYPKFLPCQSTDVRYCSNSSQCISGQGIEFECKCAPGFHPIAAVNISIIGSSSDWTNKLMDFGLSPSKREICEDIDECLFDVCGENTLRCRNLIGDYKCECAPKYVLDGGDCVPMCDKVNCKHGICRFQGDFHANCECEDGYIGPDCGQLDPSIALRKANIIICISIFGSVLVLAIAVAFSQHKQLKKARAELKLLRQENDPMRMYDFYLSRQATPLKTTHRSKQNHHQHWNSLTSNSHKAR